MKNCTRVLRAVLCVLVFVVSVKLSAQSATAPFTHQSITASTGDFLGFLQYKPADYDQHPATKYPIIIFLHGIGERGNGTTDLDKVAYVGMPRIIYKGNPMRFTWNGKTETFLVLAPQCPLKYGMWPAAFINDLIAYAKNNLRIDEDRIYLTGLSMGGGGSLRYISDALPDNPKNLSAVCTIAAPCTFGNGKPAADAHLPVWCFHAEDDPTASVQCTKNAIAGLNSYNVSPKPLLNLWPTGGHIVWDRVYTDTNYVYQGVVNIYEWFLGQNRTLPVNKLPVARAANSSTTTGTGTAMLDASASTDADGKLVRFVWKKISGPAVGKITTTMGPNSSTSVTGLTVAGTYQYAVFAVDDRAAFTSDTITVTVADGAAVPNAAPLAKAGTDITITLPVNHTTLNASASSDADGSINSYAWSKISGPSSSSIAAAGSATTSVSNLTAGVYLFKVIVTDNKGAIDADTVRVTVNAAANVAPVANAGKDITITLPVNQTTLNASGSSDADGSISTYAWSKISGPSSSSIAAAASSTTKVSNLTAGVYQFKVVVTDNKGVSDADTINVTVNAAANIAPVANAGKDITITLPVNQATLNASASSDADGSIASYAWTKVSGPSSASIAAAGSATTLVSSLTQGVYLFKVVVTDNKGTANADTVKVTVNPAANVAPIARAGADITITLPVNTATLDGTASTDADGNISSYAWTKISGPATFSFANAGASSTAVLGLVQGTYQFRLVVTDNKGLKGSDTVTVKVNIAINILPIAKAGNDITITLPLNKVTVNGNGSSDADGTINTYSWTKIAGPGQFSISTPNAPSTQVVNLVKGVYQFRLLVTDNRGGSDADTITVTVNDAPPPANVAPIADAGANQIVTLPLSTVTLKGDQSFDADGTIKKYAWSMLTGPAGGNISNAASAITTASGLIEGTYTFRLVVTDDDGATDADTVAVIVNAAILPPPVPNVAPIAKAGNNITITLPRDSAVLNGSASLDSDGTITNYTWSKIGGPAQFSISSPTSSLTEIRNLVEGVYSFRLQVKDDAGEIGRDTVTVTVLASLNTAPIANAGQDFAVTLPNPVIRLNGLASTDPDGEIVTYAWTQVSGPSGITITNSSTSTPGVTGVVVGEYIFRLTTTDNTGSTGFDDVKVTVLPADEDETPPIAYNFAPVAQAGPDQTVGIPETTSILDGTASHDQDNNIASYNWQQVSGPSIATIAHPDSAATAIEGLAEGDYSFVLTVTDSIGAFSTDTMLISVVNNLRYEEKMSVYPNPAKSNLMLQMNSDTAGRAKISIYNVSGVLVQSFFAEKTLGQFRNNMDVSKLQAGLYYVEVVIGQKQRMITKFIKR